MTRAKVLLSGIAATLASSLVSASCTRHEQSEPGSNELAASSHAPSVASSATKDAEGPSSKVEPSSEPTLQPRADGDENHLPQSAPRSAPILEEDPNSNGVRMGKPLFSCGYANFAWGNKAYGHVLDDQGRIWFYDLGKTWSPRPAGNGLYLVTGLEERFGNSVLQSRRVPPAQLAAMRKKAKVARDGRVERKHMMYDAGGEGCEAYVWGRSDAYQKVELGSSGDLSIRNSSLEAGHLREWLTVELGMGAHPRPRQK